jgi:exopolysaccharide biosynthesis polyprenyl glycosylphosphotransferase
MTLTTGLAPVAPAADATVEGAVEGAVEAVREAFARPGAARRRSRWMVASFDLLAGALASVLTVLFVPPWGLPVSALVVVAWPLSVLAAGGYSKLTEDPYAVRPRALVTAGAQLAVLGLAALATMPGDAAQADPSRLAAASLLLAGGAPILAITLRSLLPLVVPPRPATLVVVGPSADVRVLLAEADRAAGRRSFAPVAVCLTDLTGEPDLDPVSEPWPVPVWYGEEQLLDLVRLDHAEAVLVVPGPGIGHAELRRWGALLQDVDVDLLVSPGLRDVAPGRLGLATLGGTRLLRVRPPALSGPGQLAKQVFDRTVAALLLVLLAPVLGVLALLVRSDSPGPAFFRQTRVGRHGLLFTVYKMRTMCHDADRVVHELAHQNESDRYGVLFKIKRDPRITRLGAWLRKYSLDELPQLLNVVRGEMSLVGPRPALPGEVAAYDPDLNRRLDVKPGMTGLWQVSGRSDLSWEDTVRLDLQYVDNWSWRMDARIAVRTASAVLGHRGAY